MNVGSIAWRAITKARQLAGLERLTTPINDMGVSADSVASRPEIADTTLGRIFIETDGRIIHKWLHYFPIYERYFAKYRGSAFKMLEIGVFQGGSLEMWRSYFGQDATIFGVDINPQCARYVDRPNQVRIGSQADPAFLRSVVQEMGGVDVILDDGSHVAEHQALSFEVLFPLLKEGGLYVIEDMHTAYWPKEYNGGYRRSGTAIEMMKTLVDDMHHWYHGRGRKLDERGDVGAIHFHDSVVVIEKVKQLPPIHTKVGNWNVES